MSDTQALLEAAKQHAETGDEAAVQSTLIELLQQEPHDQTALRMLGGSFFVTEKYTEAAVIFEQLVLMLPTDGAASIGLHNTLWKLGRNTEAVEEIRRFFEVADRVLERDTLLAYRRIIETLSASEDGAVN